MIRVGIVSCIEGLPDPYALNDVVQHVMSVDMVVVPHFAWSKLDDNIHYVVTPLDNLNVLDLEPEDLDEAIMLADNHKHEAEESGIEGIIEIGDGMIAKVDLDYSEEYTVFTLSKAPDVWIHAMWRS